MKREQRVKEVLRGAMGAGITIALVTIAVSILQDLHLGNEDTQDFLSGVGYGVRTAFPLLFFVIMFRAYRAMDEYGRLQMLTSAAVGFVAVMGLSMAYYPLQEAGKIPVLPVWVTWVVGILAFCVSMGVQSRR